MFFRKYVIPILAVAGVAVAVYTVRSENKPIIPAKPVAEPARPPFESFVAGAGIVESSTQNIAIGTNLPGVVFKVHAAVGARVKAGDPLFSIDDRAQQAELAVRRATLMAAQITLARLRELPRAEDIPPAEARVREMQAALADMNSQLAMWESVPDRRAVSQDELNRRRFAVQTAEARVAETQAALALLKAGAWKADIAVAEAQVEAARAQAMVIEIDLERLTVRAPVDGELLQVNIRVGEYATAGAMATPLMLMGNLDLLHVRVDIDEFDAWRIRPGARATASLRGNSAIKTDISFVRVEPFVVPKRSLTGDSTERVDTRVLQLLYSFPRHSLPVYVGQQMDVYIEAPPRDVAAGTEAVLAEPAGKAVRP